MDNFPLQLGVGGLFAILALREVRALIAELPGWKKQWNGPHNTVAKLPELRAAEVQQAVIEGFGVTIAPALAAQTELLREIRDGQRRLSDEVLKMATRQLGRKGTKV